MKKRYYIAALALAALMLSACANSETTDTSASGSGQTSQTQSAQASGSSTASSDSNAGTAASDNKDNTDNTAEQIGGADAATQIDVTDAPAADDEDDDDSEVIDLSGSSNGQQSTNGTASDNTSAAAGQSSGQTYDEVNQTGGNDSTAAKVKCEWEGTYKNENGEQVTISSQKETSFHFAFEVSMISGQAEIDGIQAIYYGDDDNQVVFNYGTDAIMIEVTNSNGDDTSESPLIGMYTKVTDDTAAAKETEDTEDTTE